MTHPPTGGIPGIPGGESWSAGTAQPPSFVTPAPSAATPAAQFELAGWGPRLGAYTIDQIIRLVASIVLVVAVFVLFVDDPFSFETTWSEGDGSFPPGTTSSDFNAVWLVLSIMVVYFASALIYAPFFMARWRGATPGKRALGIRAIKDTGADLTFGQAFLREAIFKGLVIEGIGGLFGIIPLVSYLWPLWDRECRAGHDFLAGTRVVRDPRVLAHDKR